MPHRKIRLPFLAILFLFLSTLSFGQSDPRTLRLTEKLISAPTEAERQLLLEAEKELVNGDLVKSLLTHGERLLNRDNYLAARACYQIASDIAERIGDRQGLALAAKGFGVIHHRQGDYVRALEFYGKSMTVSEALGDKPGIAKLLNNQGLVYYMQGDYERALELCRQSLTLSETIGAKDVVSVALNGIGLIHSEQGDYRLALDYYQRAAAMYESAGDKINAAGILTNIGNLNLKQGNYQLALDHHQRSLVLAEALKSPRLINFAFSNMGTAYHLQGNYDRALELYQKSLIIKEELGDKAGIARLQSSIGRTYRDQNNYDVALEHLTRSLALFESLGAKAGAARTVGNIAYVYELMGKHALALEWSQRAVEWARLNANQEILWGAHTVAGKAYRGLNQHTSARKSFDEAITAIETLRAQVAGGEQAQQLFFENKLAPYHAMVELLIADKQVEEALTYAERAKSRVLLDVLQSGRVNLNKALTANEKAQERQLKTALVSFNSQLARENARAQPDVPRVTDLQARLQNARLEYEAFEIGAFATHPELKTQRGEAHVINLKDTGTLLTEPHSALLEYVVTDEHVFLFVLVHKNQTSNRASLIGGDSQKRTFSTDKVQPTTPALQVYTLNIKGSDLIALVERFRQQLAQRDLRFNASARELYDSLIKPAEALLQSKSTLIMVPDGILWELPFQALQDSRTRYLIEDHAFSYAPSLTVLREMSRIRRQGNASFMPPSTLLALGNPALAEPVVDRITNIKPMDQNYGPLLEAEKQVKTLGQLYGATRSRVYVGAEATEERIKAESGKFRIVQLATHGILNNSSPMYSHLVLAQSVTGTQEDGLLEAWEIMNLDLKADLVVLSACETARGRVAAGEGVIGLTWALFVAGSPATVVSQWKVESASTTELMLEFHRSLQSTDRRPHQSTASALQQASLKLLKNPMYRHPFYWGGFVIIGDAR